MIGLLRVKNEARWIADVLRSIAPACDEIFVFDDHSTDETPAICMREGAAVWPSPFEGLDEARDKDWMLDRAKQMNPDWALLIDGDEALAPGSAEIVSAAKARASIAWYSFRILYLWDSASQIRTDGVYRDFRRTSMFRIAGQPPNISFRRTSHGGNFHCTNSPRGLQGNGWPLAASLLHYGYMHQEDRIRKHAWYNAQDPQNDAEDCYRHIVQGDVPEVPAGARLRHAGPLELRALLAEGR